MISREEVRRKLELKRLRKLEKNIENLRETFGSDHMKLILISAIPEGTAYLATVDDEGKPYVVVITNC